MAKLLLCTEHDDLLWSCLLQDGQARALSVQSVQSAQDGAQAGNVYVGKVARILPALAGAFIDFGASKPGFLAAADADVAYRRRPIEALLRPGQAILVQVSRAREGRKGAKLTCKLSLAGTFLTLRPLTPQHGVSRRITDGATRQRLEQQLQDLAPPGMGLVARTAAAEVDSANLRDELAVLLAAWQQIAQRATRAPALLHAEADVTLRALRDWGTEIDAVICDAATDSGALRQACAERHVALRLHVSDVPLWDTYGLGNIVEAALQRRVTLPSGGDVVFEHTEAMCVIDVNSGSGSRGNATLITNCEAANAIATHLALRDIGGLITIDFIDMDQAAQRQQVMRTLRAALQRDRAKTVVDDMSRFALVSLTRRSRGDSVRVATTQACARCHGDGTVRRAPPS